MTLLIKGITKLSELVIDADKDWQVRRIANIKSVTSVPVTGDLIVYDGTILAPIRPSLDGYVLTSQGPGKVPTWAPAGGTLKYYFPFSIGLTKATAKPAVNRTVDVTGNITRENKYAISDAPADNIRMMTEPVALSLATAKPTVNQSIGQTPIIGRDISIIIEGAVSEPNGGPQTDETAAAQSGALNDMNLNPMTPAAGDCYYFGFSRVWPRLWLKLSTPGTGNWNNVMEYWNGAAWAACVDEDDQTSSFLSVSGTRRIQWTPQGDWALSVILGMNLYWVRSRTSVFANQVQKPLGAQAWCSLMI